MFKRFVMFVLLSLVSSVSFAQNPTPEQIAAKEAAQTAKSTMEMDLQAAETADSEAADAKQDALSARQNCPAGNFLDEGDEQLQEGNLQVQLSISDWFEGTLDDSDADDAFGWAVAYWNAGNYATAKTYYDTAAEYYGRASTDYSNAASHSEFAKFYYESAEQLYLMGGM